MKRIALAFLAASAALLLGVSLQADYIDDVRGALQRTFKDKAEFESYQFYGTPVGNFGVGTMFTGDVATGKVTRVRRAWLVGEPRTWWADSMKGRTVEEERTKAAERESLLDDLFPEGTMGRATIKDNLLRNISADVTLGLLKTVVPISFSLSKDVRVEMSEATAVNRLMNWDLFYETVQQKKVRDSIRNRIAARRPNFVIVAGDIVLRSYHMTVTLNPQDDTRLNQGLLEASVKTAIGTNKLLSIKQTRSGVFEVTSDEPLVIARMLLRPPAEAERGTAPPWRGGARAVQSFEGWRVVDVPNPVLEAVAKTTAR
jgi:hypothetical protein